MEGIKQLRLLAKEYLEHAMSPINARRMELHRAVNDLNMQRPVVLIDEIPFHELNFDGSLTLLCEDPILRSVEDRLRKKLFQWKYFPADMILEPFVPVTKVIRSTGIGVEIDDDRIYFDKGKEGIAAHKYRDRLSTKEEVEMIKPPVLTYDKEETMRRYIKIAEAIGDIIPV